jgi:hypothetical protein
VDWQRLIRIRTIRKQGNGTQLWTLFGASERMSLGFGTGIWRYNTDWVSQSNRNDAPPSNEHETSGTEKAIFADGWLCSYVLPFWKRKTLNEKVP